MKIVPLNDKVLVKRAEAESKSTGGIILPDNAKEKPKRGEVLSVGPGKVHETGKRVPVRVKAGQVVLFGSYAGSEVRVDGEDYLLISEDDIMATLD